MLRRRFLRVGAVALAGGLAGCSADELYGTEYTPEPVTPTTATPPDGLAVVETSMAGMGTVEVEAELWNGGDRTRSGTLVAVASISTQDGPDRSGRETATVTVPAGERTERTLDTGVELPQGGSTVSIDAYVENERTSG